MPQDIKVIAPAVVLIIVVAVAGAYALNKKSSSQDTKVNSQMTTETKDMIVSTPSYDQIVNNIAADVSAEEAEVETEIESTVQAEAGADDSIINATGKENYESKF